MAAASAHFRQAGFHLSQIPGRSVRGWVFLARVPQARHEAEKQSRVLAAQTFVE
jgi:hypothetical protein